ncbi:MAG: nitrate reductase cytochrome c-type subunit, partial [Nitrospirae bacterium]|nr:nitrate reductase cytochrome c-type subunit [Nitrospirota bacterium]
MTMRHVMNRVKSIAVVLAGALIAVTPAIAGAGSEAPLMKGEAPPDWKYEGDAPGTGKVLPRGWEAEPGVTAPPQIPHDVTGLTIAPGANSCLGCHNPQVAPAVKAKAVPET